MHPPYQPHVDILRALAVLLVIFNHLEFPYFSGGFIGVDIFFVISGYLITQNLLKEKNTTGKFSYSNFYKKRTIRLAPAFFTVTIASSSFFLIILTPEEAINYLKTIIASLTLTSNIYYTSLLNNYFSISSKSTPLLHFWSLSLEEQFYLFWPLFFIFILKFSLKTRVLSIIALTISSLFFSHILVQENPTAAYYLLPSRVFEFGIGALLVFVPKIKIQRNISVFIGSIIFLSLVFISNWINPSTLFPSYTALIPCLLAAVFIYASQSLDYKYLNSVKYLGKISYPMYLWHWPIIVYLSLLSVNLSFLVKTLTLISTIFLAALTYEFIEKRIRKYYSNLKQPILTLFILPSTLIILLATIYSITIYNNKPISKIQNNGGLDDIKCIDQSLHPRKDCLLGNKTKNKVDIFLVGDSHANSQSGFIDYLATKANLHGYEITHSSTAFLLNIDNSIYHNKTKQLKKVEDFNKINKNVLKMIAQEKPKYVVMGAYFPHNWERNIYTSPDYPNLKSKAVFMQGLSNAITEIQRIGAKAVLINDNPFLVDIDIHCNLRNLSKKCYFDKSIYLMDFSEWDHTLDTIKKQHPSLIVIDFNDMICKLDKCYSSINNIPLYRDSQHMTYRGAREIAIEYLKKNENPFN